MHAKISSSTKDLHDNINLIYLLSAAGLNTDLIHGYTVGSRWRAEHPVVFKGLVLYNNNTHKGNMLHYSITVPPGGKTVLFPSVTECYFLLSPFICFFFSCDNLEMSSKSNIFISCVAVIYWKGNRISASSRAKKRYCIQAVASVHYHDGTL